MGLGVFSILAFRDKAWVVELKNLSIGHKNAFEGLFLGPIGRGLKLEFLLYQPSKPKGDSAPFGRMSFTIRCSLNYVQLIQRLRTSFCETQLLNELNIVTLI